MMAIPAPTYGAALISFGLSPLIMITVTVAPARIARTATMIPANKEQRLNERPSVNLASHFFAFNPISTRRRIAGDRAGLLSCFAAHFSTASSTSCGSRIVTAGSRPVAGRPRLFWCTVIDLAIFKVHQKCGPLNSLGLDYKRGCITLWLINTKTAQKPVLSLSCPHPRQPAWGCWRYSAICG